MKTKVALLEENNINKDIIRDAANKIKEGGTVVFPTETVYGIGANALESSAVKKIFEAKGRPQDNPLILHVGTKEIDAYVKEVPEVARQLMDKYWPGPLTLIFNKKDIVPDETSAKLDTVGIRMPSNNIAIELIKEAGVPVAAPSANTSGKPSPTRVERCIEDLEGKVDYIIGGDISEIGVESTIVDCTKTPLCILRPGGITLEMLKKVDPEAYIDPAILKKHENEEEFKPKAPGMKYRHYAPKAQLKIITGNMPNVIENISKMVQNYIDDDKKVGIMATDETKVLYNKGNVISVGSREDLTKVAKSIFETLRKFDDEGVDIILCEGFEESGLGIAIMNRLKKAAGYDITLV